MNTLNRAQINRPPARPQDARQLPSKMETAPRAGSTSSTERRVETETERIAVLGYN